MMKEVLLLPFCAALLLAMPVSEKVNEVLPYLQGTAAFAVFMNNALQVAERWKEKEL